jgi:hypothetical protein
MADTGGAAEAHLSLPALTRRVPSPGARVGTLWGGLWSSPDAGFMSRQAIHDVWALL